MDELLSCDSDGVVIEPLPCWGRGSPNTPDPLELRKVTDRRQARTVFRLVGRTHDFPIILNTWMRHPHRKSLFLCMRNAASINTSELTEWMVRVGLPLGDIKWYRERRQNYGSPLTATAGSLEDALAAFSRELLERCALADGCAPTGDTDLLAGYEPLRQFDAVINGRSLYALDQAALEQLLVSVDWHLNRRGN